MLERVGGLRATIGNFFIALIHIENPPWIPAGEGTMTVDPKQKDRGRYSYDEGADEPASLIEKKSIDIQKENPIDDTEPVEQTWQEGIK